MLRDFRIAPTLPVVPQLRNLPTAPRGLLARPNLQSRRPFEHPCYSPAIRSRLQRPFCAHADAPPATVHPALNGTFRRSSPAPVRLDSTATPAVDTSLPPLTMNAAFHFQLPTLF